MVRVLVRALAAVVVLVAELAAALPSEAARSADGSAASPVPAAILVCNRACKRSRKAFDGSGAPLRASSRKPARSGGKELPCFIVCPSAHQGGKMLSSQAQARIDGVHRYLELRCNLWRRVFFDVVHDHNSALLVR